MCKRRGNRKRNVSAASRSSGPPPIDTIRFSVAAHAAWAPGLETPEAWLAWAQGNAAIGGHTEPALPFMPPLLRRRASPAGKMALHAAHAAGGAGIPVVFCSRHGECRRSVDLLDDLTRDVPMSPTAFSLSVHNATGGLFSIARGDHANSLALAAGRSTIEHAAIEACGLLDDGAPAVLLVAGDSPPPAMYRDFADCDEQTFGWAWLLQAAGADAIGLRWSRCADDDARPAAEPGGLQVMRFFLRGDASLERIADGRRWTWSRDA
jgi:hypothetical protein